MAALILDTGTLIAIDRGDRRVGALLHEAARHRIDAVTSCVCVAEAWRDPPRQARLARALTGILDRPLDPRAARACGRLLAESRTSQVADAALALLAGADDLVLTDDAGDVAHLLATTGSVARVRAV
ncbi:MAG: PIN domain-containing protein [Solirubrobacteraceae bacterium]